MKKMVGGGGGGEAAVVTTGATPGLFGYFSDTTRVINDSKIFAGLMVLILNISTKYVKFKLSPSVEAFLKYSFSMNVLVFFVVWVGTKDLLASIIVTILFSIVFDFLLNEESQFSILPESFTQYYANLDNGGTDATPITVTDIENAKRVLKQAKQADML